jgi:ligand-binding SRPBCC domain-containing protein
LDPRPAYRLRISTRYLAPPEQVWAQKSDPQAIMAEFPPWAPFRLNRPADVAAALADGADRLRAPARLGLMPWEASVRLLEPGLAYEDIGTSSLFTFFHHTHRLQPVSDGTHYLDDVWFTPAFAPELSARVLRRVFVVRHRRAAQVLPADPQSVGHAVLRHVLEDETLDPSLFSGHNS